ncbi:hypothetical protein AGOR_G00231070 [Albula goreensis]|uniref:Proline-rich transmembrane protein 3/4 domain-containing protein n=1 Tax=Albula goreensis TaxID=1534307 RepID=A0A8T3CIZ2_9TELE|nr:hypothetical protein AGOR_G00231070 [Albula goreensis]
MGLFSALSATPVAGNGPAQTTQTTTDSGNQHAPSDMHLFWPFWVSIDVPTEARRPSSLSLPVSLTSDLQGTSHTGSTQDPRVEVTPSLAPGSASQESAVLPPDPGIGTLWEAHPASTSTGELPLPEPGAAPPWERDGASISIDTVPSTPGMLAPSTTTNNSVLSQLLEQQSPTLSPQPPQELRPKDPPSGIPAQPTPAPPPFNAGLDWSMAAFSPGTETLERENPPLFLPTEAPGQPNPVTQVRHELTSRTPGERPMETGVGIGLSQTRMVPQDGILTEGEREEGMHERLSQPGAKSTAGIRQGDESEVGTQRGLPQIGIKTKNERRKAEARETGTQEGLFRTGVEAETMLFTVEESEPGTYRELSQTRIRAGERQVHTTIASNGARIEEVVQRPTQTPAAGTQSPGPLWPTVGRGFSRKGGASHVKEEESRRPWAFTVSSDTTTTESLLTDAFPDEAEPSDPMDSPDSPRLPDCSFGPDWLCTASNTWSPTSPEDATTHNQSLSPSPPLATPLTPPLLVRLHADWNGAMATWGVAWEAHVYGVGALFAIVALLSALGILGIGCLCPPGRGYLALAHLFILLASSARAFSLFYDAYGHLDRLPVPASLLLHHAPFPCLTSAFAAIFLFLSSRSPLPRSSCQRPCSLAILVLLHFGATCGTVLLLQVFPETPPCLLLLSPGSFVVVTIVLSAAYLIFRCRAWADAKHVYRLNVHTPSLTPESPQQSLRPFTDPPEARNRAAVLAGFCVVFALACAGLQLYGILHALGLGPPSALEPWPWWGFQLGCRLCEVGVCLTLALAAAPASRPGPRPRHWPTMLCGGLCGCRGDMSAKPPPPPGSGREWEKMGMCEGLGSERLPLYALVDPRLTSLEGLDLLYHGGRVLSRSDSNPVRPQTHPSSSPREGWGREAPPMSACDWTPTPREI